MSAPFTTWIITQKPKEVPRRCGPFRDTKTVEKFLRDSYRLYPEQICIVIDGLLDNMWWPQHGYEFLDMFGDKRKRHPRKDARATTPEKSA